MTLADNVLLSSRTLTLAVRIYTTPGTYSGASVLLQANNPTAATGTPGVVGVRVTKSLDSPVPVCELELNRVPTWLTRGMGVSVDVGYNGVTNRIFTGFLQSRERSVGAGRITAMGRLWSAFRTVQIGSRSVDGVTVSSAIGTILDYVGLTDNRSINVPAFTLGTASSPVLERMPASQMLQMLMDIDGCRIYETGTGQIVVAQIDELPATTSFKTYTTSTNATARILQGSDREDPEYYRNRVIVTGATVTEGSAPDQTSRTITATATNVGSVLVQPALPSGTFIDAEYNNHLIDTDAKAASVAIRLLGKFARIPRQIMIEIAGDPEIELGQTLTFVMPELDLNDRGFVSGVEHVIDQNGYTTRLTDFRGAGDTGGTLAQNPIAAFTFKSEREVFGSAVNVVASLDASGSFDPDGTISTYAWSDNQTTSPEVSTFSGKRVTVRADTSAWTGSWSVTLTVTDNAGLTGSTTITVPYKNTETETVIPAIYAAINNNASASLDGAITWKDSSGSTCISVGARPSDGTASGYACFGYSNGTIKRTTDGCATLSAAVYTFPSATAVNDVVWDWRNSAVVWAISEQCELAVSLDYGVTWGLYGGSGLRTTLGLSGALGNKIGLPAAGGVYIFGGNGTGTPLIAFDAALNNAWAQVTMLGDPVTDFPADATMRIVDYTVSVTKESMILSWASGGGASITAVYTVDNTTSPPGTSRTFTRASTTFGGLKSGRLIVADNPLTLTNQLYCCFANRSIWSSTDGIAWTETANFFPAAVTPFHGLFMSDVLTGIPGLFGVFMFAASDGLYKWTSGEATASYLRPSAAGATWPASAIGKKIAVGASGASVAGAGGLARIGAAKALQTFDGSSHWTTIGTGSGTAPICHLMKLASGDWFYIANIGNSGDCYHSPDGVTWSSLVTHDANRGVYGMDVSADGTVWVVVGQSTTASGTNATKGLLIYKIVSPYTSATLVYTDAGYSTNFNVSPFGGNTCLAADKFDANNIIVVCAGRGSEAEYIISINGGTFTQKVSPTNDVPRGSVGGFDQIMFANRNATSGQSRLIYMKYSGMTLHYSDTLGDTWTASASSFSSTLGEALAPFRTNWNNNLVLCCDPTGATQGKVYISRDNGVTWTDIGISDLGFVPHSIDYDYSADIIYVGNDTTGTQKVSKITGAFNGTPTQVDITLDVLGSAGTSSQNMMSLPR